MFRPIALAALILAVLWSAEGAALQDKPPIPFATLAGHGAAVLTVAFSADSKLVATGSTNNQVKVWNARTGDPVDDMGGHEGAVTSVQFTRNGKNLLAASWGAKLFRVSDCRCLHTLEAHTGFITCAQYSPDDRLVATGSHDSTVKIWDSASGAEQRTLMHPDSLTALGFSSDGKSLFTTSGPTIRSWDAADWKQQSSASAGPGEIVALAVAPKGGLLATASGGRTISLWDASTLKPAGELGPIESNVTAICFSPNGLLICIGREDGAAAIWDVAAKKQIMLLRGHEERIHCVAFSPDGKSVAVASSDSTVTIWEAPK